MVKLILSLVGGRVHGIMVQYRKSLIEKVTQVFLGEKRIKLLKISLVFYFLFLVKVQNNFFELNTNCFNFKCRMGCGAHVTTVATIATVAAKPNCFKANQHHKYTILTVATVATKPNCFKANQHHKYTILRWAQWIVFLIEINLLLPSALIVLANT